MEIAVVSWPASNKVAVEIEEGKKGRSTQLASGTGKGNENMILTDLIYDLPIRQLRLRVLRVVRPHKNTDDVLPIAGLLAFLDDLPGRVPDKVEIMPEARVLSAW